MRHDKEIEPSVLRKVYSELTLEMPMSLFSLMEIVDLDYPAEIVVVQTQQTALCVKILTEQPVMVLG